MSVCILVAAMILAWAVPAGQARAQSAPSSQSQPAPARGPRYYYPVPPATEPLLVEADVCVYGSTPAGVTAAVQAGRMGRKAVLVSFGRHVGGMTSGGLSGTDVGKRGAIGGMANEFYARVGLKEFRPSAAEKAFRDTLQKAGAAVYDEHRLVSVRKDGARVTEIRMENGRAFRARVFVDATYEGDLLARAGVSYHCGRETNATYGETLNGVQMRVSVNQFPRGVDPYVVEKDPASGLLFGVSAEAPGAEGSADKCVQAYNFRMRLTVADDRTPFPRPPGYDANGYTLLARVLKARPQVPLWLPKTAGDCNNKGPFSTDLVGGSHGWPEANYALRERIFQEHVAYQQGLMWFLANDERVPAGVRQEIGRYGLPRDEFVDGGGWPHELYVREGRRIISDYVMTEHDCVGGRAAEDSVGLGSYTLDSHHCRRLVAGGSAWNEGGYSRHLEKPYPISYRSIVPKEAECTNLLVPVCLSSSHVAYGSIRMEPVFMILGQSAGTAAALAIDLDLPVQKVPYDKLRQRLLADKQVLSWPAAGSAASAPSTK